MFPTHRELYFHQPIDMLPRKFHTLLNIHTISYPLQDPLSMTVLSGSDTTAPLLHLPHSLQGLELRDAFNCSPEELRLTGLSAFTGLNRLKVSCGALGAWGPVPAYGMGDVSVALKRLATEYTGILSPLERLRSISFDVHLSDTTVSHPAPSPAATTTPVLLTPLPVPTVANAITVQVDECAGTNVCARCWEARRAGSQQRETLLAKMLGKALPYLTTVDWTIWYRERGQSEEKRRVTLSRGPTFRLCHSSGNNTEGNENPSYGFLIAEDEIACSTTQVPLALYPAILG